MGETPVISLRDSEGALCILNCVKQERIQLTDHDRMQVSDSDVGRREKQNEEGSTSGGLRNRSSHGSRDDRGN